MAAAAFHKASKPRAFTASLRDYRVLPAVLVPVAAAVVLALEVLLVVALLSPGSGPGYALACAALIAVYSLAIAVNLARGRRHIDCGCLGPAARQTISGWLLVRNGALVAACLVAAIPATGRTIAWLDLVSIAGGVAVVALLFQSLQTMTAMSTSTAGAGGGQPVASGSAA
jgi:hypothetical protein